MARPFRLQPPSPPGRALVRRRLVESLAQRWHTRLATIVAGPGFGKTALLVAAMADATPVGRDVWLSCEPSDSSAPHLIAGIAEALGLVPSSDLDRILDSVWAETPQKVCFLFDDVHEIAPESDGAAALRRLVDDLPANGHVVVAARHAVPIPTARLAAAGQLVRIGEGDLLFDRAELDAFALARGVDASVLTSSGGWPAVAELAATAGSDLVLDYLWEEVLDRVGTKRARLLARFATAGGGDTRISSAIAGEPIEVEDLVADVPLVERGATGWVRLHPLWGPPLRRLLTPDEANDARRRAAAAHLRVGRLGGAVDLLAEAEEWDDVLAVIRDAVVAGSATLEDLGRWYEALPPSRRDEPGALLARGLHVRGRSPLDGLPALVAAVAGFRSAGDVDGEVAAIHQEGLVRWWANDFIGLLGLHGRAGELAAAGSREAEVLEAIGAAALAHLSGDSAGVFTALARVGNDVAPQWSPGVQWLRSVAHRRNGDLVEADRELDTPGDSNQPGVDLQKEMARLRAAWLRGDVDRVLERLPEVRAHLANRDQYLLAEASLELAAKAAWLGELEQARQLLASVPSDFSTLNALTRTLHLIATVAIAVGTGDEETATNLLRESADATPGRPESWFWRDRAAIALPHVLVPSERDAWEAEPLGAAHLPVLLLAAAFEAAREGNLLPVRQLTWPPAGVIRAQLPRRWLLELAAAGHAAGNPPPDDLIEDIGGAARAELQSITASASKPIAVAAAALVAQLPSVPPYRLRICILGPLEVWRDGEPVSHPDLRRGRVRELLCHLAARRQVRREQLADDLWPELDDPARNLRVTLTYLQRVLQPDRVDGDPPYFLRSKGAWLSLLDGPEVEVDAWRLDAYLDDADAAERSQAPGDALAAYRAALPLWRGEPFSEISEGEWGQAERSRLRDRYVTAALRAGELLLAAGEVDESRDAARRAITAEPSREPAYQLLARCYLSTGDRAGALRAIDDCRSALATLGLQPSASTLALAPAHDGQ